MLLNLHKKTWMDGLSLQDYNEHCKLNENTVTDMLELAKHYNKVFKKNQFHALFIRLDKRVDEDGGALLN